MSPSVSVVLPILINDWTWQKPMSECAIRTLKETTDEPFELVVVETGNDFLWDNPFIDKYVNVEKVSIPNADANKGIDAASGEYIVYTGNDVFVRPGWLECLLECFEISDCGAATLASMDLKHAFPWWNGAPINQIKEGVYGPFMMFSNNWRYDAKNFPCQFGDTDLIMRIYESGRRMYRNWNCVIQHLNKQTLGTEDNQREFEEARRLFTEKYGNSPLRMSQYLIGGQIV